MRILVTGIAGSLGRRLAHRLALKHTVLGIDMRHAAGMPDGVRQYHVDLRRRTAEDVFRQGGLDAVIHLGMVHNFRISSARLYEQNVVGTETLLKYVRAYGVKKLVLLSSADVYGPMPTNSHFIPEDAPLMASQRFPEIRTLIDVDRAVQSFFWRHGDIEVVILRPVHIVGPHVRNGPSKYFRMQVVPTLMGFDPMLQLIHEDDLIDLMVESLTPELRGIFNVAGTDPVPLSRILKILKKPVLPVPHFLLSRLLERAWRWRLVSFPAPELDHIRFNTVLDTSRAARTFKTRPSQSLQQILEPFCAVE